MADADKKKQADQLKAQGNEALKNGKNDEAIRLYTEALTLDETNEVLYSNRSAVYAKQKDYIKALDDAEKAIEAKPSWSKGWSRKGTALCYLNRYEEAKIAFEEGLKIEPENQQMKDGLAEAEQNLTGPGGSQPMSNPFAGPDVIKKLEANRETRKYLEDPGFRMQIEMMQRTGNMSSINDPRLIACLGVLLGVDLTHMEMPEADMNDPEPSASVPKSTQPPKEQSSAEKSKPQSNSSPNSSDKGVEAKERGNVAYKAKKFDEALAAYDEAIALDPSNMTFLNNKAAVFFEMKKYPECIEVCEQAVEIGRTYRSDFMNIAKALARQGKAYLKMDDETNALRFLNKSLSEHRTPEITKLVVEVNKSIKAKERLAYINPEVALEEKNKGNEYYQKGKYPEALQRYTEAIKRNPQDPKLYSNRAACYTKLLEFQLALRDCDECLRIDPKFIKGYLRKGAIYTAMKDDSKATTAYQKALEIDPNCSEAQEGYRNGLVSEGSNPDAVRKRAMENPEIQEILSDPAMRLILEQMQKDPNALKEHLKNPDIASKIEKLLEAGIIAIR